MSDVSDNATTTATPSLVDTYTAHIQFCLVNAKQSISGLGDDVLGMPGASGLQTRHFYNDLLGMPDARYLEVGMGDSSLLCAGLVGNSAGVVSIGNGGVQDASGMAVVNGYKGSNSLSVSSRSLAQVDVTKIPKMNIVSEGGLVSSLGVLDGCLDDVFVYVTGDWNNSGKQASVRGAVSGMGWNFVYEKEIFTPGDGFPTWGNGIFVGVVSKVFIGAEYMVY
jgi:hypothetical protein